MEEVNKITNIGQKAIDIMKEVLDNITPLETKIKEVQNDDKMQEINDMQEQLRAQLQRVQEIQPLTQEAQEKIVLLEELQKAYIKINQHIQQALGYEQDVKQQLQEIKNQMHEKLDIRLYRHEEYPEDMLRPRLDELIRQLENMPLPIHEELENIVAREFEHYNDTVYPLLIQQPADNTLKNERALKFNVTTIFRKSAHVHQIHEHTRGKIQQEMQKLREKAKKVERNEIIQQKLEQQLVDNIQTQMEWIQEKAREIEEQATKAWDEYYMKIACLAAQRSKDPSTPVGACIVDKKKRKIVGIGYNSMPMDKDFTWKGADKGTPRDDKVVTNPDFKYAYVVHAAVNAITNKTEESIEGCTLYTTLHPDEDCAHAIIAAGIKEVVYCMYMSSHKDKWDDKMKKANVLFKVKGIDTRELLCDLSEDKYVKELKRRIKTGEQETKRAIEPATAISWEKFFMRMAKLSQKRPGDYKGKAAGVCIVSSNKQIKAVEYSGEPDGLKEEFKDKAKELYPGLDLKVDKEFFTHAEYRAIVGRPPVEGCTLYVTSYPCNMCAKVIVQAGITKVVYYKDEGFKEDRYYSSRQLLTTCLGATNIRKYNGNSQDDSQDEHKGIIAEGSGRTYIAKITTITDIQ